MPDHRRHRGPHPGDPERFAAERVPELRAAASDLAMLLGRDYPPRASLQLVGDRFALDQRQRLALMRACCAPATATRRRGTMVGAGELRTATLWIDGFNVLTTVEAALGGGVLLRCQDGCLRDLASMHGTFRSVAETGPAVALVAETLAAWQVANVRWLFDQPVSNAGRLAQRLRELAAAQAWPWRVDVVPSPDRELAGAAHAIVATADGPLLDRCGRWVNLARAVVERAVATAWIVDFEVGSMAPPTPASDGGASPPRG